MKVKIECPRGTKDVLPAESYKWNYVEKILREQARIYGISEIRVPMFEHTELFQRGVGDTTDVVQKEMYTFEDKKGRSITLRPELTAGTARSIIQNGLLGGLLPLKAFYIGSCFRYEKAQTGRYREFHQFGVEMFGTKGPLADAELISLASSVFEVLGVNDIELQINSIGCKECRKNYHKALREYFAQYEEKLCPDCKNRLEKNPMRLLDCKVETCKEIAKNAPKITDYICDECKEHFDGLKNYLDAMGINYTVNPTIVRGLDYYTKTVFEFVSTSIGSQGTVCGGGRYDGLIEELGGTPTPALGFAIGLERLILVMEAQGIAFEEQKPCDIYIGSIGEKATVKAAVLCDVLRKEGFSAETDLMEKGVKGQMKYANKIGSRFSIIIGDDELSNNKASLKNMKTGETKEVALDDSFVQEFYNVSLDDALGEEFEQSLDNLLK